MGSHSNNYTNFPNHKWIKHGALAIACKQPTTLTTACIAMLSVSCCWNNFI